MPTYLERSVHQIFSNTISNTNIIVIYGESRQGKTWMIEKYCRNQIRIGCTSDMNIILLKEAMLYNLGLSVLKVEHTVTKEQVNKNNRKFEMGVKSKKSYLPMLQVSLERSFKNNKFGFRFVRSLSTYRHRYLDRNRIEGCY